MSKVEFKIKKKTKVDEAGGKTTTKLEYTPIGVHEKHIKITVSSSEVADEVGLATGRPDDAFFIDFDVEVEKEVSEDLAALLKKKESKK